MPKSETQELKPNQPDTPQMGVFLGVKVVVESEWIRWDWVPYRDEFKKLKWQYVPLTITKVKIDGKVVEVNIPIAEFNEVCRQVEVEYSLNPVMTYECDKEIAKYFKSR
jgi:hypothetical protein